MLLVGYLDGEPTNIWIVLILFKCFLREIHFGGKMIPWECLVPPKRELAQCEAEVGEKEPQVSLRWKGTLRFNTTTSHTCLKPGLGQPNVMPNLPICTDFSQFLEIPHHRFLRGLPRCLVWCPRSMLRTSNEAYARRMQSTRVLWENSIFVGNDSLGVFGQGYRRFVVMYYVRQIYTCTTYNRDVTYK